MSRHARARNRLASIALLAWALGGCVLVGFDAVSDAPAAGAGGTSSAGVSGSGGVSGLSGAGGASGAGGSIATGGTGAAGISGGSGGIGGAGGTQATAGSGGTGGTGVAPPVGSCAGQADGTPCDDGVYCTLGDSCLAGVCSPGTSNPCPASADVCKSVSCDELNDSCLTINTTDGTPCGFLGVFSCAAGVCVPPSSCSGADCNQTCSRSTCSLACGAGNTCDLGCDSGGTCDLSCAGASSCAASCDGGSSCSIDCTGSEDCQVECSGGSACSVRCDGDASCGDVTCKNGAQCTLDCGGAGDCQFSDCQGAQIMQGDGSVVCGT